MVIDTDGDEIGAGSLGLDGDWRLVFHPGRVALDAVVVEGVGGEAQGLGFSREAHGKGLLEGLGTCLGELAVGISDQLAISKQAQVVRCGDYRLDVRPIRTAGAPRLDADQHGVGTRAVGLDGGDTYLGLDPVQLAQVAHRYEFFPLEALNLVHP